MQPALIRAAIAQAASSVVLPEGLPALTCTGFVPDRPTDPHFFAAEYQMTYDRAYGRGMDELELTCRVLVGRQDDQAAQTLLDLLLAGGGDASLKQAIEAARGAPGEAALGGLADDLHVVRLQGYRWYEHAGVEYVGGDLIIRVIGSGD